MSEDTPEVTLSGHSVWSHSSEAVLVVDAGGTIRFATPSTAQYYGYTRDAIVGQPARHFIAPEDIAPVRAGWQRLQDDPTLETHEVRVNMLTATGRRVPIRATMWRLPGAAGFLVVLHIFDHLRDRLETLYSTINAMSSTLDLNTLIDTVLHEVHRLVPSDTCTIAMLEPDQTVHVRRWNAGQIESERALPADNLPEFATSRIMRETGRPLLIDDTLNDPRWTQPAGNRPIRSWLGTPLIHRGTYLGELTLDSPETHAFSPDDAELAAALANQVAAALHNARQFDAEQRRAKRFQAVSDVSKAINRLELDEVLDLVYEKVRALMAADAFFIGLFDPEADTVRIAGFYDHDERRPDTVIPSSGGLTGIVLQEREPVIIQNAAANPLIQQAIQLGDGPQSVMIMPLITQDEIIGVISVQSYEAYAYAPDDIALLEVIADAVATAVRNAQLYDQTTAQLRAQQALHQLSLDLAASQTPARIAELVVQAALDLLKPAEVRLYMVRRPTGGPDAWTGLPAGDDTPAQVTPGAAPAPRALIDQAHAAREIVLLHNGHQDPRAEVFGTAWPVHTAALYPIRRGDRAIATLVLLYDQPQTLKPNTLRVIEMLGLQAAGAFETARYTINLTRRLHEVTALHELARRVGELDSLDDILNTVVVSVRDALRCRSASVALLEPDGETVTLCAGAGLDDQYLIGHTFARGEYVAGAVVEQGRVIYVRDTLQDPEFRVIDPDIRALMSVPLTVRRRTIGALNIDSGEPDTFTAHHERILTIAGGQIAAAIENLRLLDETRQRAAELAEANRSLAAQDELRRELVFQVSHDLRGPLQIIYGYTDMLHDEMLGPVTPTQKDILALMLKRCQSIERMTQDILVARPISADMLEMTTLDLTELCRQTVADAQIVHQDQPHTFDVDLLPRPLLVEADYHRLSRVFDNLIGNAVKFSPDGGTIRISTAIDAERHMAHVAISDQGIGIADEKLPYIFERFYRGDRAFRKQFEGAGLGLYIVQQIVEAHQGRIWVESQEGIGSTFIVALPLAERA